MHTLLTTIASAILAIGSFFGFHAPVAPSNAPTFGSYNPTGGGTYRLQSSIGASDTSITLSSFTEPVSGIKYTMNYLNSTIEYATLEPQSSTKEFVSFTGISQNADGSATLTGVTRGLSFSYPYTASTTFQQAHPSQSIFILSNPPQLTNQYVNKNNDETITGTLSAPEPTSASNVATKNYVDTHVNGGTVSVDHVAVAGVAGETVSQGQVLYFKSSDQRWYKASISDGLASTTEIGIAQGAGTVASSISGGVLVKGLDTHQAGLVLGNNYYLGATAGATSTVKSGILLGQAKSATELYFDTAFDKVPRWGGLNYTGPSNQPASSTVLTTDGSGNLFWLTKQTNSYLNLSPNQSIGSASTTIFSFPIPAKTLSTGNYYKTRIQLNAIQTTSPACNSYYDASYGNASTTLGADGTGDIFNGSGYVDIYLLGNGATNSQKLFMNFSLFATSTVVSTANSWGRSASSTIAVDSTAQQNLTFIVKTNCAQSFYPAFVTSELYN